MSSFSRDEINQLLATNVEFRAEYIANPKPVLAQFGQLYPDSVTVHIIETSPVAYALIIGAQESYPPHQLESMPPPVAAVVKRSFVDPGFKALLTFNPVEAIFLETGFRIPEGASVTVYETTPNDIYLPLPAIEHEREEAELSELELDEVSGGSLPGSIDQFFHSTIPAPGVHYHSGSDAPNPGIPGTSHHFHPGSNDAPGTGPNTGRP